MPWPWLLLSSWQSSWTWPLLCLWPLLWALLMIPDQEHSGTKLGNFRQCPNTGIGHCICNSKKPPGPLSHVCQLHSATRLKRASCTKAAGRSKPPRILLILRQVFFCAACLFSRAHNQCLLLRRRHCSNGRTFHNVFPCCHSPLGRAALGSLQKPFF